MENIFVEFLPPWVETGLQPAFYDKESGTVLQQTARMYARVNMLIRMFNKLSKNTKTEIERFEEDVDTRVTNFEESVNTRVTNFEDSVNETVADYIDKFNQLHDYVHDYFDNLDVQEEINNKLDQMLKDGVLQEIISQFLQSTAIWCFDTVADMQVATNLIDGSFAKTLGYYNVNDDGDALYKITNTAPSGYYETLNSGLYAELITAPDVNVKQYGVKGDGITDDTTKMNTALADSNVLIIPEGEYLVERFLPNQNQTITGIGTVKIKTNGTAPQCELNSGNTIENITFQSLSESLAWNRCNISNKENITIKNCSFIDFRHDATLPNAWGILIGNSSNLLIENCYFSNNSQSDIAIVNGCNNIKISRCRGSNLFINIEPDNANSHNYNLNIEDCKIHQLNVLENHFIGTATESLIVSNCNIDIMKYDGGTTTLINTYVAKYINEISSSVLYGGNLNFVSSSNFSSNLLSDPYLDLYENQSTSSQPWFSNFVSSPLQNTFTSINDENGVQFVINPNGSNSVSAAIKHQDIDITDEETFILRVNGKVHYPSTSTYISLIFAVRWLDENNTQLRQDNISMFRSSSDSTTPFITQSAILVPPENATKLRLMIYSGLTSGSSQINDTKTIYLRSVELFRINNSITPNNLLELKKRDKRVFDSDTTFTSYYNKYLKGDIAYYKNPTTYIGRVATTDGYGSGATWKNFGAIAS